jgi:cytosine/adenosine deaminase-related metal-dependent hydrolase
MGDKVQVLGPGTVLVDWSAERTLPRAGVAWRDGRVLEVAGWSELRERHPDAERHDARGGWIAPGLINAHHHFYSALATGLDPGLPLDDFGSTLDRLWWRLDRAHDEASIRLSARLGALRCALAGVTTVVDHHASPSCIDGSLDWLAEELEAAGLSAMLCYEATDRNGHGGALRGLAESARFRAAHRHHPRLRGMIGLHAAFTLVDATLARAALLAENGDIHIHVAEAALDGEVCRARDGQGPLERLDAHNLLGPAGWLVHGVHLDGQELDLVARRGALLVHNPESNANNRVGRLDLGRARRAGVELALGTDGMSACVLGALRSAFLLHRQGNPDPASGWTECAGLLEGSRARLARIFAEPGLGRLEPGAPADLLVLDVATGQPPTEATLTGQLVFGLAPPRVRHTVARGDFLVRHFEPCRQDVDELKQVLAPVRKALWGRFAAMAPGTPWTGAPVDGVPQGDPS